MLYFLISPGQVLWKQGGVVMYNLYIPTYSVFEALLLLGHSFPLLNITYYIHDPSLSTANKSKLFLNHTQRHFVGTIYVSKDFVFELTTRSSHRGVYYLTKVLHQSVVASFFSYR